MAMSIATHTHVPNKQHQALPGALQPSRRVFSISREVQRSLTCSKDSSQPLASTMRVGRPEIHVSPPRLPQSASQLPYPTSGNLRQAQFPPHQPTPTALPSARPVGKGAGKRQPPRALLNGESRQRPQNYARFESPIEDINRLHPCSVMSRPKSMPPSMTAPRTGDIPPPLYLKGPLPAPRKIRTSEVDYHITHFKLKYLDPSFQGCVCGMYLLPSAPVITGSTQSRFTVALRQRRT
jgi:hypothetical protein